MSEGLFNISAIQSIEDKAERFRFILFLLFIISLPFEFTYSSVAFVVFAFSTLFDLKWSTFRDIPRQAWLFQGVFYLALAGYFFSLHRQQAQAIIERQITVFLLPLLLPMAFGINKERIGLMVKALSLSCIAAVLILFIKLALVIHEMRMPFVSTVFSGLFFNHSFSRPLSIHAGYLSLYVAFSIIHLVDWLRRPIGKFSRIVAIMGLFVLSAGMFFLASRNAIISLLFFMVFIYPLFVLQNKKRYLLIALITLGCFFTLVRSVPYLWQRFSKQLITEINPMGGSRLAAYDIAEPRIERWRGALELAKKSPLVGYGTGDERDMLKVEYAKRGLFISYFEAFNAHNQYLSYLIKNGVPGLILFIALFYYYARLAYKSRNLLYAAFLTLLIIGFYTENILDSNKGILFFAIFNTAFGYQLLNNKKVQAAQNKAP